MTQRGKKGPIQTATAIIPGDRGPPAPRGFSTREKQIWQGVVENMKPGWYGENFDPLLRSFCTTGAVAEKLSARLRSLEFGTREYLQVARAHREATQLIISLSTKLRIAPSANRPGPRTAHDPLPVVKPWLIRSNDDVA